MKDGLKFSIIICSLNGANRIASTLKSLQRLKYPKTDYEIIVVDDGSSDATVTIARRFKDVRIVSHDQNQGIAVARNSGLAVAKGRWVAYIDDDCTAHASWLLELEKALQQPRTLAAGGSIAARSHKAITQRYLLASGYGRPAPLSLGVATTPLGRFRAYVKNKFIQCRLAKSSKDISVVHEVYGANVAFPKIKLQAVKGFTPSLKTSEDTDICQRLHVRYPRNVIRFNPRAVVRHNYTATFFGYLGKLFVRQKETLAYYRLLRKTPPIYPFPLMIIGLAGAGVFVHVGVAVLLLALLPLILYSWWTVEAARRGNLEFLAYAYMEWLEESTRVLGLLVAGLRLVRMGRKTKRTLSHPVTKKVFFGLIAAWLVIFNVLQLSHNPLQAIVATVTLLTLPGSLLMMVLRITLNNVRAVLYAISLSICLLMLTALAADGAVLLTSKTLRFSTLLFTASLDILLTGLLIGAYLRTTPAFGFKLPRFLPIFAAICASAVLPFAGAVGTITLNNAGNNALSMMVLGVSFGVMIALVVLFKKVPAWALPLSLFSLSLTFILMGALRGSGVSGTDISKEFYLFQLVQQLGYWSPAIYPDPYNSCLAIHILPVLLSDVIKISGELVCRVVEPALYAVVPVMVYALYTRFNQKMIALAGALFFIAQPVFMKWSAIPVRQMFGFIFFGALLLALFDRRLSKWPRYALVILFGAAMIFSHYSTTYIGLGVLLLTVGITRGAYVLNKLRRKKARRLPKPPFLITIPMLVILTFSAWVWYGPVTHASGHALDLLAAASKHFSFNQLNLLNSKAHSEQANVWDQLNVASAPRPAQDVWKDYVHDIQGKYERLKIKPLQAQRLAGLVVPTQPEKMPVTLPRPIAQGAAMTEQVISKLMRVFLMIGLSLFMYWLIRRRHFGNSEFYVTALAGGVVIVLIIVVPHASIDYDLGRTSQQLLFLLALPTIIGGMAVVRFLSRKKLSASIAAHVVAGIVVISFLFISHFVPELAGGQQPSNLLNNTGLQHQTEVRQGEMAAAKWLVKNHDSTSRIYSGYFGRNRLWVAGIPGSSLYNDILPWTIDKTAYVFSSYDEAQKSRGSTYYNGSFVHYTYPAKLLNDRKDIIYDSGQARIYK